MATPQRDTVLRNLSRLPAAPFVTAVIPRMSNLSPHTSVSPHQSPASVPHASTHMSGLPSPLKNSVARARLQRRSLAALMLGRRSVLARRLGARAGPSYALARSHDATLLFRWLAARPRAGRRGEQVPRPVRSLLYDCAGKSAGRGKEEGRPEASRWAGGGGSAVFFVASPGFLLARKEEFFVGRRSCCWFFLFAFSIFFSFLSPAVGTIMSKGRESERERAGRTCGTVIYGPARRHEPQARR